jgi:hypothetical protein
VRRSNTVERIVQYQELGKDVPLEVALKRVLILAQRGDWPACEQSLRFEFLRNIESAISVFFIFFYL